MDPREARREDEERDRVSRLNTFELMARAWHAQAHKDRQWSTSYAEKVMRLLELHVFPWIGSLAMEEIKPTELVRCLHRIRKMKMREWMKRDIRTPTHLVPLPTQAVEILRDIFPLTGPTGPIFRSMSKRSETSRYMSDNTVNSAYQSGRQVSSAPQEVRIRVVRQHGQAP